MYAARMRIARRVRRMSIGVLTSSSAARMRIARRARRMSIGVPTKKRSVKKIRDEVGSVVLDYNGLMKVFVIR